MRKYYSTAPLELLADTPARTRTRTPYPYPYILPARVAVAVALPPLELSRLGVRLVLLLEEAALHRLHHLVRGRGGGYGWGYGWGWGLGARARARGSGLGPLPLPLRLPLPLCATCMRALILAWLRLESAPCLRGSWLSYLGRGGGGSERVVANRTW